MILVDTSVWVDHLRFGNQTLVSLLETDQVLTHPFVIGELACGRIRNRREILRLLATLPAATVARHEDVLTFVDGRRLYGRGIGWIDVHLLASAVLSHAGLLTLDQPLARAAGAVGVAS
jgi:predicted nucleic acid-binding protein